MTVPQLKLLAKARTVMFQGQTPQNELPLVLAILKHEFPSSSTEEPNAFASNRFLKKKPAFDRSLDIDDLEAAVEAHEEGFEKMMM